MHTQLSLFSSTDKMPLSECGTCICQLFTTGWLISTFDYGGTSPGERTWMTWSVCVFLKEKKRFQSVWLHFHITVVTHQYSWTALPDLKNGVFRTYYKFFFTLNALVIFHCYTSSNISVVYMPSTRLATSHLEWLFTSLEVIAYFCYTWVITLELELDPVIQWLS